MKTKRILSVLSILLAALLLAPALALPASASGADFADDILLLVNAEREAEGLPALKTSIAGLHKAATVRVSECVVKFDIVEHMRPNGTIWHTALKENGVTRYATAGETLAAGYDTPAEVIAAWMDNAQDRTNILHEKFTHVGIGVYEGEFQLGDDPQQGYIVALQFIMESKYKHPDTMSAAELFLQNIWIAVIESWNGLIQKLLDLFNFAK